MSVCRAGHRVSERLKDFVERNFFRLVLLGGIAAFIGVFVFAVHLEQFNKPPPDLKVPFGSGSSRAVVEGEGVKAYGDLTVQNLSGREISQKLGEIIAEGLSFTKSDFTYNSAAMEKYFAGDGYNQYRAFLKSSGLQDTLARGGVRSGAYMELNPLELSSGVYNGAYKWLFEVPVTISFVPLNAESYRDEEITPENRRFTLRVQFTRVRAGTPDAVMIELWQVLPARDLR